MVIGRGEHKKSKKEIGTRDVDLRAMNMGVCWLQLRPWKRALRGKEHRRVLRPTDKGSGTTAGSTGTPTRLRPADKIERRGRIYPYEITPSFKKFSMSLGRKNTHTLNSFYRSCWGLIRATLKAEAVDIRRARKKNRAEHRKSQWWRKQEHRHREERSF